MHNIYVFRMGLGQVFLAPSSASGTPELSEAHLERGERHSSQLARILAFAPPQHTGHLLGDKCVEQLFGSGENADEDAEVEGERCWGEAVEAEGEAC